MLLFDDRPPLKVLFCGDEVCQISSHSNDGESVEDTAVVSVVDVVSECF